MKNSDITNPLFHQAVEAIDAGDITALQQLLETNSELVTKPLETLNEKGYFANPYLLWFIANNPIRYEKMPSNILEGTQPILDVLHKNRNENIQHIIDYTLGLVCTGRISNVCGVQIPLMEVLIKNGAQVKGSVLGSIGQHNFEAAKFLLDKGCDYDVGTAVGLNRLGDAKKLIQHATDSELYVALVVASFFGNADMISLLLKAGADVNGSGTKRDFGGFHSHASALHQAVYSGSLESVKLLVDAGANLNATEKGYNGTPLGWAMYMQTAETSTDEAKKKYAAIEDFLNTNQ